VENVFAKRSSSVSPINRLFKSLSDTNLYFDFNTDTPVVANETAVAKMCPTQQSRKVKMNSTNQTAASSGGGWRRHATNKEELDAYRNKMIKSEMRDRNIRNPSLNFNSSATQTVAGLTHSLSVADSATNTGGGG
jgi:hypothetical protein